MFKNVSRRLAMRTSGALFQAMQVPQGFSFHESKAEDLDPTKAFEPIENLRFTLTRQDEQLHKVEEVKNVSLCTISGEIGVFPGHEYKISKLIPGPITVEKKDGTFVKYFSCGGFAHINNEGHCDVNTVECIPVDELDLGLSEKELASAQADLATAKTDSQKAVADIRVEVAEAVIAMLKAH